MSRIQQIEPSYQKRICFNNQCEDKYSYAQNFGKINWSNLKAPQAKGKYDGLSNKDKKIAKVVERKIIGWGSNLQEFLAKHDCEVQKQLINALFTATLAPLMIAKNPSSNQDDDTKKYMAMRQPLSAVIAIAGGVSLTMPIENWVSKTFSEGHVPSLDLRMAPDRGVLFKQIKKADKMKIPSFLNLNQRKDRIKMLKELNSKVETEEKAISEFFGYLVGVNPDKIKYKGGKVIINDLVIKGEDDKPTIKTLSRKILNINSAKDLTEYLKKNNLYKQSFSQFMKETLGFELFDDGTLKFESAKLKLKDISAIEFLKKLGIKNINEEELLRAWISIRQDCKTIGDVAKSLKISEKQAQKLVESFGKNESRLVQGVNGGIKKGSLTLEQLLHRLGYVKGNSNDIDIVRLEKELMNKNVSVADAIKKIIHGTESENPELSLKGIKGLIVDRVNNITVDKKSIQDFALSIAADKSDKLSKQLKTYKGFFSLFANLFITVITCSALNWVYPRFMDKFFPELSKAKKTNGSIVGGRK